MNMIDKKICNICLNQSDTPLKSYENRILYEIPALKHTQLNSLCIWCFTTLKKISIFLSLILESQKINGEVYRPVKNYRSHNLSICINESVNIQPFSEVDKVSNEHFLKDFDPIINEKALLSKPVKSSMYSEMKYKIEFLSLEKQMQEIERRKITLKYTERLYKCEECGLGFLTADVFDEHRRRHMFESGNNICNVCSLRFKSKAVLSQHKLLHSRVFICILCGIKIKKWSQAVTHRHKCGSVCVTACVYCGKVFGNSHSLKVHVKNHTKEKKYECKECKRKFGTKQRLRVHARLHTGLKPFICECGKKFTTKSNLKSHQNVHSILKKYYCVECNTNYKTERGLKKHFSESVKHTRDRRTGYSCSHCNKTFSSATTLSSHQRVKHLTQYTCDVCNKNFSSNSNLRKHIRCIHKKEVLQ